MSSETAHKAHGGHEGHHHGGPLAYTLNLIALLILTGITVGASLVDLGSNAANVTVALAIATMKALLVGLIFMHLRWDKPTNAIIAVAGFLFLGIFLGFDLLDANTRRDADPRRLPLMAAEEATPVPDTTNPLETPAPQPLQRVVGEGLEEGADEPEGAAEEGEAEE